MARETVPPQREQRAPNRVPWGKAEYNRTLDDPEELIRRREGCVDEEGTRRIRMGKTSSEYDDPRLYDNYAEKGYEIKDKGYYYELSIPQSDFLAMEEKRHAADRRKIGPQPKDPTFSQDEDTLLAPVSANDLLAD